MRATILMTNDYNVSCKNVYDNSMIRKPFHIIERVNKKSVLRKNRIPRRKFVIFIFRNVGTNGVDAEWKKIKKNKKNKKDKKI